MAHTLSPQRSIPDHFSAICKFRWLAISLIVGGIAATSPSTAIADIHDFYGAIIPGTEGMTPGPSTSFDGLILRDADLRFVDLTGSSFVGAGINRASFFGSTLLDVDFSEARITDVNFDRFSLAGTRWVRSNLDTVSFTSANLEQVDLSHSRLTSSNFTGANLQGANLAGARIDSSQFVTADLRQATLAGAWSKRMNDFTLADLELADLSDAFVFFRLDSANLSGASLRNAYISGTVLLADLRGAQLQHAKLANLEEMNTAMFDLRTQYNEWTVFPFGFDPAEHGLALVPATPGDMNGDDALTHRDIDQLSLSVFTGSSSSDAHYDLNADSVVDDLDRQTWVHDLKQTVFGDADLNGTFDSTDLVQVLASGEYEDDVERYSTWLTGDWDGDRDFTSDDLLLALADGGYEVGRNAAVVPEPAGILLATVAAPLVVIRRRCCAKTRGA
jgi:uncharacterized protein YjbI with pentapeptide repeats